jgi:hypothetical protein
MKSRKIIIVTFIAIASFIGLERASSQVIVKVKPVRPSVIVAKPAKARKNHVWIEGHWAYSHKLDRYVWVKGRWAKRPRNNARWIPGHWKKAPGGWKFVPGHWV